MAENGDDFNTKRRERRKRLRHIIGELERRLGFISAVVETERRRNTEARLEARLLEALLTARLVLKQLLGSSDTVADETADCTTSQGGAGGTNGSGGAVAAMGARERPFEFRERPFEERDWCDLLVEMAARESEGCNGTSNQASCTPPGGNCQSGTAPPADGLSCLRLPPLLQCLQAAMDGLIDDLHAAEQQGAGGNTPPPPLAHRVRSSTMLDNIMAMREQHFANARELYVWWLQRMGEASSALLDAGTPTRVGWSRGERCCRGDSSGNGGGGAPAVEIRMVEVLHTTALRIGHCLFHPWSLELLTMNLETRQPGGIGEDLWALWLEAMGISEHQEFLLLRLHSAYDAHMAFLQSERQRLLAGITPQLALNAAQESDTLETLDAANNWIAICGISSLLVVTGAVLTPWQVLQMYSAAAPQWMPGLTGFLDAVAQRAAQRQQEQHPEAG